MDVGSSSSMELPQQFRQFTISEIHLATQNFDELLVIGRGGFGMVYKGIITNGENDLVSAIKRLDLTSSQGALEFWNEVHMLSNLRHCHLVSLIGYCNDGQEIILVYEYIAQGSLEDHLHKFQSSLPWVRRLKICIGAARGLDYLHTGTGIKHGIIHRDIKSSNILLDDNWAARISDFGLSKTGPINQPATYVKTFVKGTFGYLDPDYYATGRLTRKSDVYAFGVVLFEVLSGKRAVDQSLDEEHWGLVNWAQESMKEGRVKQIVDCNIRESILPKCLKKFTKLADWCLHSNPKQRPTMAEVVVCLESVLALQEKASYTLHPAGMRIFGNKMPMFLSSRNGDKSVGSKRSLELYFDSIGGENRILRRFEFEIIKIANENFSENNKISQWSDGFMYKGRLHNGQGVSIARQESDSPGQLYKNEVSLLVKLEHEHLLRLLGYCIEGTQVFLVYDFAISSCLDRVMDDPECTLLDWNKRKKILVTIASVLMYLHQHDVLHGNVTPSNILLDESLDPKLSDFGLARYVATNNDDGTEVHQIYGIGLNTFEESKWPHPLTWNTPLPICQLKVFIPHRKAYRPLFVRRTYSQLIPAGVKPAGSQPYFLTYGTMGYIAPEYVTSSCLSTKADVYSFGVVILETVTGCSIRNYVNSRKENMTFQHYVWRNWLEETSSNIIHPRLHVDLSSITRIIHIGLLCVQVDHVDRPTMDKVVGMLTNTLSLALHMPKVYTTTFSSLMEKYSYNTNASEELLLTNDYDPTEVDDYILELCPR